MVEYEVACAGFQKPFQDTLNHSHTYTHTHTHTHTHTVFWQRGHAASFCKGASYVLTKSELHTQGAPSVNNMTD